MISATIEKLIDQVILDRIAGPAGQAFSAYEITKDVRKLTKEIFYHGDARDYIHAKLQDSKMFDQKDYGSGYLIYERNATVQPLTINNALQAPAVAVSLGTMPANTFINNFKAIAKQAANQVGKAVSFAKPACATITAVKRKPDARGTLSVPKDMVKALGLSPGDRVQVNVGRNHNLLVRPWAANVHAIHAFDALYTVDRSGNIRITKAILDKAGVKKNVVSLDRDRIIVE